MQRQWRIRVWTELPAHHGRPRLWFQVFIFWQQRGSLLLGASALTSVQHTPLAWRCACCYGHPIKGQRMCTLPYRNIHQWHCNTDQLLCTLPYHNIHQWLSAALTSYVLSVNSYVQTTKLFHRPPFDCKTKNKTNKLHGLSPRANYTGRATAASRRSDCQLLQIQGATWSAWRIPTALFSVF
jgi:hypothetical protein